jgi:protein TonB
MKTGIIMQRLRLPLLLIAFSALSLGLKAQGNQTEEPHRNYAVVTTKDAEFPGGQIELYKSLAQRMQYPAEAKEKRIMGDIMVSFFVEADSTTSDVRALKDLGGGTKEEAERLIKETKFAPAMQNGKPVRQNMMLPVMFRIYD